MDTQANIAIPYTQTIYSDGSGHDCAAVQISWGDVAAALGREHRGSPEDDRALVDALADTGAPGWVSDPAARVGWIDSRGWGLYRAPDAV